MSLEQSERGSAILGGGGTGWGAGVGCWETMRRPYREGSRGVWVRTLTGTAATRRERRTWVTGIV